MTGPVAPPRRLRFAVLGVVLGLLFAALAVGLRSAEPTSLPGQAGAAPAAEQLVPLRQAADLAPCPPGLGSELPTLTLPCLGGGPDVALTGAAPGRPTLVNVWGTWCAPCVREVPALVDVATRAGDRLSVVGVLTQDTQRNGLEFAREFDMGYPSLVDDDGAVLRAFLPGPPVTLFLDAQGELVHTKSGEFSGAAEIEALVAEHLGVLL